MGSFATDQSLHSNDVELLTTAIRGDKLALRLVIERFRIPIFAMAIRTTGDMEHAFALVEPALLSMCRDLLGGQLRPSEWATMVSAYIRRRDDEAAADVTLLDSLSRIPRIARRRAVREAMLRLALPELTALLLYYVEKSPPAKMIGLVVETEAGAASVLRDSHRKLLDAVRAGERG